MRIKLLRIQNFRAFRDETVIFDDKYTVFVGPNGTGKSTVLMALNILFRSRSDVSTDVQVLSVEDFHNKDTSNPIEISATFEDLSAKAVDALQHYVRHDKLILTARAIWNSTNNSAEVKQFGVRMGMADFRPFFEAQKEKRSAADLKEIFTSLMGTYRDLPRETTKDRMTEALRNYESDHLDKCTPLESEDQFYGFQGSGKLDPYFQWVYIPAVKDASSEQEESKNTAFGKLLERTIRSRVNFSDALKPLKEKFQEEYSRIINDQEEVLIDVSARLQSALQEWAHPDAKVKLSWAYDKSKSIRVDEPYARAEIGEKLFMGDVRRMGHGLQRAFIVSVLELLARTGQEDAPILLLGFEEPEVYQHPPQARHLATILEDMSKTQVVVTSHSPYFVSGKGVENIRLVRWQDDTNCSSVAQTTLSALSNCIGDAMDVTPQEPTAIMAKIQQIMQPSLSELYFCGLAVLVEGIEDVAYIATYMRFKDKMPDFRKMGGHFIVCGGKNPMSRPLAIAKLLSIPYYVIFDGDSGQNNKEERKATNKRDNGCLLSLCGISNIDPLSSTDCIHDSVVMFGDNIRNSLMSDIGSDNWDKAIATVATTYGFSENKNQMVIVAAVEQLLTDGIQIPVLEDICNRILRAS
jgi:predicted ATP-dependent endonuclease of OLD family